MVMNRLSIGIFTLNNLPRWRSKSCICRQQISCIIKHIAFRHLSTHSLLFHVLWRFLFIFVLECHSKYICYKTSSYVIKCKYFASCIMHKKYRHQFLAIKIWDCVNYVCLCELLGFFVRELFALLDLFWICVLLYTFSTFILY